MNVLILRSNVRKTTWRNPPKDNPSQRGLMIGIHVEGVGSAPSSSLAPAQVSFISGVRSYSFLPRRNVIRIAIYNDEHHIREMPRLICRADYCLQQHSSHEPNEWKTVSDRHRLCGGH